MASIIDQLQLLATLVFAIPLAMFGVDKLLAGSTDIGLAAVGIAALMVVLEEYVIKPSDVAADAAKSAAETVVEEPDESSPDGVETIESEVVEDGEK
jgi:hypothetical protein